MPRKKKSLLNRLSTGDKVFASLAFVLVFALSYQFAFGNSPLTGDILGEHDQQSAASTDEVSSSESSTSNEESTETSTETRVINAEAGTTTRVRTRTRTEVSTDEISTESTDEVSTQSTDQISTETSTDDATDEASTDEQSTQSTESTRELEEEFGEPVTTRQRSRIERLFLLLPVEIESEEVVSETTGEVLDERQTLLGRILDLFSF